MLSILIGFCIFAIDLGLVYNRKVELNGLTKAVALAAAKELNGTTGGVTKAIDMAATAARSLKYKYSKSITWSDAAITFSNSPLSDATWVDAATAKAAPAGKYYVKVDTSGLGPAIGTVDTFFAQILSRSLVSVDMRDRAVAGRTSINVTPLAICAMSPTTPRGSRTNAGPSTVELVEFGFRRGVNYDLMQLNPGAISPAKNYVIDPVFPAGGFGSSSHTSAAVVGPFVCTGTMWMPTVTGGSIRVSGPFPLDELYRQLNSRFDQYENNLCSPNGAPPDYNVKAYDFTSGAGWMTPGSQTAASTTMRGKLETILDLPSQPIDPRFGVLWSYAQAAKYAATEPPDGETPFTTADWSSLYNTTPSGSVYPYGTPYLDTGSYSQEPGTSNLEISKEERRVLNVPLLLCPISTGSDVPATVLAVGKFFMTVPATSVKLSAEFAGIISEKSLTGPVELYP